MFEKILQFKSLIMVGVLAFSIGSGIGAYTSYNMTSSYKDAQATAALSKQRDGYETKIAEVNEQNRKVNSFQGDTIIELMKDKELLVKERNAKVAKLDKELGTLRLLNSSGAGNGGVFYDRHAKPATCPARVEGTAEQPAADAADTGRLSKETSENLLDYARDAEITRLDLITQTEYSAKVTERYNELVRKFREVTREKTPSSHP